MQSNDLRGALEVATEVAREAGDLLRGEFHRPYGPRGSGGHADVDDEIETLVRSRLLEAFPDTNYVGEETGTSVRNSSWPTWYVDPNDGTRSFLKGFRGSAISIALVSGDLPVLGVVFAPLAPDDDGDFISWAEGEPVRRNGAVVDRPALASRLGDGDVVTLSQNADRNSAANAVLCAPARFRALPSIAYRGALIAVGEGEACVSLNGPVHWDYAAAHALLRAVGGELVDEAGRPIRYGRGPSWGTNVFGGHPDVARELAGRRWESVHRPEAPPPEITRQLSLVRPSHQRKVSDAGRLARAQGCLLGQLAGDALGALVEFKSGAAIARLYPDGVRDLADGGPHDIVAGQPTDDSEMALALARSIVAAGRFDAEQVRAAYVAWRDSGPFDIGGTTAAGLSGRPLAESQANGALMRVSPLAIHAAALPPDKIARLAREDAAITHPNPVCGDASAVFCIAIGAAITTGLPPSEVHARAVAHAKALGLEPTVVDAVERAAAERPADFLSQQGWVLVALQEAFFQLLHAPTLEDGVVASVMAGGDTDTNAAITGALLGAVHGREAVPQRWRRVLLSCRTMTCPHPRPKTFWPVDALELAEALLAVGQKNR